MRRAIWAVVGLVALVLPAVGCGDDDTEAVAATTTLHQEDRAGGRLSNAEGDHPGDDEGDDEGDGGSEGPARLDSGCEGVTTSEVVSFQFELDESGRTAVEHLSENVRSHVADSGIPLGDSEVIELVCDVARGVQGGDDPEAIAHALLEVLDLRYTRDERGFARWRDQCQSLLTAYIGMLNAGTSLVGGDWVVIFDEFVGPVNDGDQSC